MVTKHHNHCKSLYSPSDGTGLVFDTCISEAVLIGRRRRPLQVAHRLIHGFGVALILHASSRPERRIRVSRHVPASVGLEISREICEPRSIALDRMENTRLIESLCRRVEACRAEAFVSVV